jgi:hypothetical protein
MEHLLVRLAIEQSGKALADARTKKIIRFFVCVEVVAGCG